MAVQPVFPKAPFILLVNPWITDFAAFDLWAKPMGLLLLASLLRDGGCGVALLDCLDRHDPMTNAHPEMIPGVERKFGTGKYPKMMVPKPEPYKQMPRYYYRHGIHPESLKRKLRSLPKPDLIWVTSNMTYWYPGVRETISAVRRCFPESPVWLGGIYARLCPRHASRVSGADEIIDCSTALLPGKIESSTGFSLRNKDRWARFTAWPSPALDLLPSPSYAPLMTSKGCPFKCPYCASQILQPEWERRSAHSIYEEVVKWHTLLGVSDFALYDDALLLKAETTLLPALRRIVRDGPAVRFHTPNAVHVRALDLETCRILREVGFTTLRLGLETTSVDKQARWGGKVDMGMFFSSVGNLVRAGFSGAQIGVYLLGGLPGQSPEEVEQAVRVVGEAGAQPYLCEYSPLPGTPMWPDSVSQCSYDLAGEPLYHNNTFFACRRPDFSYEDLLRLKDLARQVRQSSVRVWGRETKATFA
jgi:radical SAM superfamily enzyme YgiQ (UPF0313 family)